MRNEVLRLAADEKGFLEPEVGMRLHELAVESGRQAPCVEIGSYCGKSALYLGEGCRRAGRHPLFTVDHHRGSSEQQPGEPYFDPDLYDADKQTMRTLCRLADNIRAARLEQWIIPILADSMRLGPYWPEASIGLLFLDGGHSRFDVFGDYRTWARCVRPGGYLCIHDVYPDPRDGGPAPHELFKHVSSNGEWDSLGVLGSLATLRKRGRP